ncbi:baseplate assembly protein [Bosea vaviloviae]|uniref:baseplate assembly protein n=1 Tax=Bosea vaviloviae TaxID=1526658 RepID=UPI0006BAE9BF|nr:baseplate J/gp47 family protein [Bosea vaviloviae]
MSRFTPIDLSLYPISDVVEALDFESYLARDRADFTTRWEARRLLNPSLPAADTLLLESEPSAINLQVGAGRELLLRGHVNDRIRALTLAGALGRALDHIGITYYRTPRRVITPATETVPAVLEDDETYRHRLAIAPESWSTAGPVGAYLFWALSASGDVLDVAAYSEDEGVTLAPRIRVVLYARPGADEALLIATVRQALSRVDIRPMGDLVTVEIATVLPFDMTVILRLREGSSPEIVKAAARQRVLNYCSGRLRWIGDGETGPVWLIGRRIRNATVAAAAFGADPNVMEVEVPEPADDINQAHEDYTDEALAGVGSFDFEPLPDEVTAHLFKVPLIGTVTIEHEIVSGNWS